MFKNALYILSALAASTVVLGQCTNYACNSANDHYKECQANFADTTSSDFKACLCTNQFLVNYQRCSSGYVCAWDGNPGTLNQPCITLYCEGEFVGGFDAAAFCAA
ncbi:hypothetical protein CPB86DRAFT_790918 [Serendipita vermifera]|nr:hypothetical protein CPB86DRAFT_790918 [Serendipita vermifera]